MKLFDHFSNLSRLRKLKNFNELMCPSDRTTILDVGAQVNPHSETGFQLIDSHSWKHTITAVNISPEHVAAIQKTYPKIDARVADACDLPWPDNHFDIVYSNAVIKHVGDFQKQKKMASEIMRISRRWFITTPNRWYPFEYHMRLPFVTWLPGYGYLWAGRIFSYSHVHKKYKWFTQKHEGLRLMSTRDLHKCFPGCRVIKQRITFMPETLIVIGGDLP